MLAVALAALVTLGGCATAPASKAETDEVLLESWLLGHYDNRAQVATDQKHGGYVHPATSAVIVRVESLMVGDHVFYMQLSDTDVPTHLTEQFILSITVTEDKITEAVWAFAEPKRWKNAADSPEILSALQPADLKLLQGCSLEWKKTPEGEFTASNDQKLCHSTPVSVPRGGRRPLAPAAEGRPAGHQRTGVRFGWRPGVRHAGGRLHQAAETQQFAAVAFDVTVLRCGSRILPLTPIVFVMRGALMRGPVCRTNAKQLRFFPSAA